MTKGTEALDTLIETMAVTQSRARVAGEQARHARIRAQVLECYATGPARGSWRGIGWIWATGAAVMAVAMVLGWTTITPSTLTFRVNSAQSSGQAQALIVASDEPLELTFSDGSAIRLEPRSRVRVGELRDDGADILIESGEIEARLEPRPVNSWRVEAGPYHIDRVGAGFMVRWRPQTHTFDFELRQGEANIRGPDIGGVRVVKSPARLVLGAVDEHPSGEELESVVPLKSESPPVEPTPSVQPSPSVPRRIRSGPAKARALPPRASPSRDWQALAREGLYAEALHMAQTIGFSRLYRSLEARELLELADVGRYAGQPSRAREALMALRRRFPGTDAAAMASFDLGRLASNAPNKCDNAAKWFRTYLQERPRGSMAKAARRRVDECGEASTPEPSIAR